MNLSRLLLRQRSEHVVTSCLRLLPLGDTMEIHFHLERVEPRYSKHRGFCTLSRSLASSLRFYGDPKRGGIPCRSNRASQVDCRYPYSPLGKHGMIHRRGRRRVAPLSNETIISLVIIEVTSADSESGSYIFLKILRHDVGWEDTFKADVILSRSLPFDSFRWLRTPFGFDSTRQVLLTFTRLWEIQISWQR